MKYGSLHDKDNNSNNRQYSTSGSRGFQGIDGVQNSRTNSGDYHSKPSLNTDGLLRSSSGSTSRNRAVSASYSPASGKTKKSAQPQRKKAASQQTSSIATHQKQTSGGSALSYRDRNEKKKKKKKGCGCLPILLLVILIAVAAVFAFRFSLKGAFSKIKKYPLDKANVTATEADANMKDYQNIALFGVDSQDNKIKDKGSRTDCIIIASINNSTKKVKLMSIYRDTYVSIDGEYDKINAAYSYGGPELALRTINRNLDLNITDFATVNFKALADAVDVLGGIPLTINSEKELENLNAYIGNMNHINGGNSKKFDKVGTYTFDGNQAVAYSRIRYMEGGDHARASHQRLVLEGIMNAAKKQPLKLGKLISTVLPQCKTSLSNDDLTKLTLSMARCKIEDSQAYPFKSEDERYNGIYYGFPITAKTNVTKAHEYLFGTKDYEPVDELQKISEKIKVVTDYIGITE